ncbi:MAG: hypothetical protein ACKOAD_08870 [Gammaproteobacteria bacterium]
MPFTAFQKIFFEKTAGGGARPRALSLAFLIVMGIGTCAPAAAGVIQFQKPPTERIAKKQAFWKIQKREAKEALQKHVSEAQADPNLSKQITPTKLKALENFLDSLENNQDLLKSHIHIEDLPNGDLRPQDIFKHHIKPKKKNQKQLNVLLLSWPKILSDLGYASKNSNASTPNPRQVWIVDLSSKVSEFFRSLVIEAWWAEGSGGQTPSWDEVDIYDDAD